MKNEDLKKYLFIGGVFVVCVLLLYFFGGDVTKHGVTGKAIAESFGGTAYIYRSHGEPLPIVTGGAELPYENTYMLHFELKSNEPLKAVGVTYFGQNILLDVDENCESGKTCKRNFQTNLKECVFELSDCNAFLSYTTVTDCSKGFECYVYFDPDTAPSSISGFGNSYSLRCSNDLTECETYEDWPIVVSRGFKYFPEEEDYENKSKGERYEVTSEVPIVFGDFCDPFAESCNNNPVTITSNDVISLTRDNNYWWSTEKENDVKDIGGLFQGGCFCQPIISPEFMPVVIISEDDISCDNGLDDDNDGHADCDDADCYQDPSCLIIPRLTLWQRLIGIVPTAETRKDIENNCNDGVDNDNDNLVDCADDDCSEHGASECPTEFIPGIGLPPKPEIEIGIPTPPTVPTVEVPAAEQICLPNTGTYVLNQVARNRYMLTLQG